MCSKLYLIENNIYRSKYSYGVRKQYTQFKFDENLISIMTYVHKYMHMHAHTIVYIYLCKKCKKQVWF